MSWFAAVTGRDARRAALVLALGLARTGQAQLAGAPAPGAPAGRFVVAGGIDGFLRDGDVTTLSPSLHLGYQLVPPVRALGLRVGLDYMTRRFGPTTVRANGVPIATVDNDVRFHHAGLVALGTYHFGRGRVRPYAVGGAGLYYVRTVRRVDPSTLPPGVSVPGGRLGSESVEPAVSAGLGLEGRLRAAHVFAEGRLTSTGTSGNRLPLLVGLRF